MVIPSSGSVSDKPEEVNRADMRIAISGTHFSGKSTLVEALSDALPQYMIVEEPYHLLEEEGYEFSEFPSLEDFEMQLKRSIESLEESASNVVFDRCPADILGYLLSHIDAEAFDLDVWLPRIHTAIRKLDLVVFLPIEEPDRIVLPMSQDASYRQRVDEKLKEIILDNSFDFEVDVLEATGSLQMRVEQVLAYISVKKL
jgi:predicted ATPase